MLPPLECEERDKNIMTKQKEMQLLIRHFKDVTGKTEITMREVAQFAVSKGWPLPVPLDPLDRLAKQFSEVAREETKYDKKTGKPYRVYHAVSTVKNGEQTTFWVDLDEAERHHVVKSAHQLREQMVGAAYQLSLDLDHWNSVNPDEEPVTVPLDLTDDVAWRKNTPQGKVA
jgi:hypothetical protein